MKFEGVTSSLHSAVRIFISIYDTGLRGLLFEEFIAEAEQQGIYADDDDGDDKVAYRSDG